MLANERIDLPKTDELINSVFPPANVFAITLAAGAEALKRGTVMATTDGTEFSVLGSGSGKANCILAEDTEAGATTALAYRTGHFNENCLIGELTEADKEALRDVGILLSDAVEY